MISHGEFATGRTKAVWRSDERLGIGLTVSPDEKTLLFSTEPPSGELDLMMIENFR